MRACPILRVTHAVLCMLLLEACRSLKHVGKAGQGGRKEERKFEDRCPTHPRTDDLRLAEREITTSGFCKVFRA